MDSSKKSVRWLLAGAFAAFNVGACTDAPGAFGSERATKLGSQSQALNGVEGMFEYAIDAPWRIEPSPGPNNTLSYGAIPIQLSLFDEYLIKEDASETEYGIGRFCGLDVKELMPSGQSTSRHYDLADFALVESSTPWASPATQASEVTHLRCKPSTDASQCASLSNVTGTAEWQATAWYTPAITTAGANVPLEMTARFSKFGVSDCNNPRYTLTNSVVVHLGEAQMPRFDNRWLYGDLHYHSEGTDNEGEMGYSHAGTVSAMGALGLDFAFATEHASNSEQKVDAEIRVKEVRYVQTGGTLRDMSHARFDHLLERLDLTNRSVALTGAGAAPPQTYLSHGAFPQLFLGGELDAIPEAMFSEPDNPVILYGNGLSYNLNRLTENWPQDPLDLIPEPPVNEELFDHTPTGDLIKDLQGLTMAYGRNHLVYLPRTHRAGNFIGSNTSEYGGGTRRFADDHEGQPALLPEIEAKGYAFLAHPLSGGGGGWGPDTVPYSMHMLDLAWKSPGILGLQFWNEPVHLATERHAAPNAIESGYLCPDATLEDHYAGFCDNDVRVGLESGNFVMRPFEDMRNPRWEKLKDYMDGELHHGAAAWDRLLMKGLSPEATASLSFLRPNEPRRFFIAGGSDAHGEFNFRREGYFTGLTQITDVAIGKARNLVFTGGPTLDGASNGPGNQRHSQEQIVSAIAAGRFSVTDGPALRIAIDTNNNGVIDDTDTQMGDWLQMTGSELNLLVEWKSTPEFGKVNRIDLYLGALSSVTGDRREYAPRDHGPRRGIEAKPDQTSYTRGGRTFTQMGDNYWTGPGNLSIALPSQGVSQDIRTVRIRLADFEVNNAGQRPDRIFVRAFAKTALDPICDVGSPPSIVNEEAWHQGRCISHYAYANPVWAVPAPCQGPQCIVDGGQLGVLKTCYEDTDGDGVAAEGAAASVMMLSTGAACPQGFTAKDPATTPDCAPSNPLVYPGALEWCDAAFADSNCNPNDEGTVMCYRDGDGDGWGAGALVAVCAQANGTCPAGYASKVGDCCESDARAFPGQSQSFDTPRNGCGGYDFDCSATEVKQYGQASGDCSATSRTTCLSKNSQFKKGFAVVPACGAQGEYISGCGWVAAEFDCMETGGMKKQACR